MKRFLLICMALLICMVPCLSFAEKSSAATNTNLITVKWVSASNAVCNLSISDGVAENYIYLTSDNSNIDSANFAVDLQQYKSGKWVSIKKWKQTKSVNNYIAVFDQNVSVEKGYKYRLKGTIKVYAGSTLKETLSISSSVKTY